MKLFRRYYWLISGLFKKYAWGITLSLILGAASFFLISKFYLAIPSRRVSHVGRVGLIYLNQLPQDIQQTLSYGLTQIEPDGQVSLAAAQAMDVSADGKTYTVSLKPGLSWSDGSPVKTSELDLNPPDVTVSTPTDATLVFTLKEPFAPFPSILSQPLLKKTAPGKFFQSSRIIGLRSAVITDIQTKQQYVNRIRLEDEGQTIVYHFYPTETDALTAFKLGHVDRLINLSKAYLADWPHLKNISADQPNRYVALFFNTADPNLQDKAVRQMLAYATPKTFSQDRVLSPIAKTSWVYNPQVKPYDYQPETARNLLLKQKETNPQYQPEFILTTTPAYADTAQAIAASWTDIGITTQLRLVPFPDTQDFQILLIGQQIPDDPDQYALWHSTQNTNIAKYQNPKIDKLLEDGRRSLNPQDRQEIYQEFQRFLVEDSPAVFLHQLKQFSLSRS